MRLFLFAVVLLMPFYLIAQDNVDPLSGSSIRRLPYPSGFDELIEPFKGKVIYIDVMASWCKPCLEELNHYNELDSFFYEKDIVKLFISIDDPDQIEKAFQALEKNNMKGYFVSYHSPQKNIKPNANYTDVVESMFMSYNSEENILRMSVPQYIIIDRKGEIAEYKASRPSDKEKLKRQLSSYLDD